MKKAMIIMMAAVLAFCLAACGAQPAEQDGAKEMHSFTANNVNITMDADATDILKALGEPKSKTEEASCAFEGLDRTYYYGNFYLTTYPNGDKENVFGAWFVDDSLSTAEGIYIGCTKAQVEAAYGADAFNGSNAYVVTKGASKLTVILENDEVTSITYDAVFD